MVLIQVPTRDCGQTKSSIIAPLNLTCAQTSAVSFRLLWTKTSNIELPLYVLFVILIYRTVYFLQLLVFVLINKWPTVTMTSLENVWLRLSWFLYKPPCFLTEKFQLAYWKNMIYIRKVNFSKMGYLYFCYVFFFGVQIKAMRMIFHLKNNCWKVVNDDIFFTI